MSEPIVVSQPVVVSEYVESVVSTPPASVREKCPGAPERTHRGKGILACDFIKPDPELTLAERRAFLLEELDHWLTGDICGAADEISMSEKKDDLTPYLVDGTWPAARMAALTQMLSVSNTTSPPFALRLCKDFLEGRGLDWTDAASLLAVGFVTVDTLPSGKTIRDLWNQSPFEPLRSALPLSPQDEDEDEEEEEEEDEEYCDSNCDSDCDCYGDEEEEVDIIHHVGPSIDDKITTFLTTDYTVTVPGWLVVAVGSLFTVYMWLGVASCYSSI
jgi:hypothetical protein